MLKTFLTIFSSWKYNVLALAVASFVFVCMNLLVNMPLLLEVSTASASFLQKIEVVWKLLSTLFFDSSLWGFIVVILISILFGIQISLFVYLLKNHKIKTFIAGVPGIGGIMVGLLGIGCGVCGGFFISPIIIVLFGTGALGAVIIAGIVAHTLALALLLFSIYALLRSAVRNNVCEIQ